jgi:hypothetical protein
MLKELVALANHLDKRGLRKEADYLDSVIQKIALEDSDWDTPETFARDAQSISIGEEMAGLGDTQSMMLEDAVNTGMRTEEFNDFMSRWNRLMSDTMSSKKCLEKALSHAEKADGADDAAKLWRAIVNSHKDPYFIWDKEQGRDPQEGIDYPESELTSKLMSTFKLSGDIQEDTYLLNKLAGYREFFKAVHRRLLDLGPPSLYGPEVFISRVIETTKQALEEEKLFRE